LLIFFCVDRRRDGRRSLGQHEQDGFVHVVIHEHDGFPGLLEEGSGEGVGVENLPVEEDALAPWLGVMALQSRKNLLELLVGENLPAFDVIQSLENPCMVEDEFAHRDKGTHDLDADFHGPFTPQYRSERGNAFFREGIGQRAAQLLFRRYRILRYHLPGLIPGELKHEILGEPVGVSFHLFSQANRFHVEKQSQIAVEQDLQPPERMDSGGHLLGGQLGSKCGGWFVGGHWVEEGQRLRLSWEWPRSSRRALGERPSPLTKGLSAMAARSALRQPRPFCMAWPVVATVMV